jgi:hypothetical protein
MPGNPDPRGGLPAGCRLAASSVSASPDGVRRPPLLGPRGPPELWPSSQTGLAILRGGRPSAKDSPGPPGGAEVCRPQFRLSGRWEGGAFVSNQRFLVRRQREHPDRPSSGSKPRGPLASALSGRRSPPEAKGKGAGALPKLGRGGDPTDGVGPRGPRGPQAPAGVEDFEGAGEVLRRLQSATAIAQTATFER